MTRKKNDHLRVVEKCAPDDALVLECSFRGIEGLKRFSVQESEYDRTHSIFSSERKAFLAINTLDGRSVFINLAHLQTCRLCAEPFVPPGQHPAAECHMLGGEVLDLSEMEIEWVPNVAMALEEFENLPERFLSFPDELGSTWMLNMADIVYLEFPTRWHDQAYEADFPEDE